MADNINYRQLLDKQFAQLQQLETIIDEERLTLQKNSPDALAKVTEQKNMLLLDIQTLDQQFSQSLAFSEQKANGELDEVLKAIEQALLRCKEKNQVNGHIIQQSQMAVERLKTTLLQQNDKSSVTYDSKGKTSGGLSSLGIKA
ncbi:flagella synthesis protein FlgN [Thalassotalea sp. PP2-459]|uniref:flagella synthesis protein FlgN n=1 Tax=Thalassotalea sp. PP2-459 TaxID=1742724 RepID=UPI00094563DA|nr:flagellar protein FlgN [Thalassotalea sp. PP2-459]OKY24723.1 flagellar biosynthesis protein FlgN [Thalassotalea sp. PP2-459]